MKNKVEQGTLLFQIQNKTTDQVDLAHSYSREEAHINQHNICPTQDQFDLTNCYSGVIFLWALFLVQKRCKCT